ncbi:MAG: PAS domain-containing protein [Bacteroidetes bacterium]|nr:PAS domain-containing protein [Bacteroidota bacterium]
MNQANIHDLLNEFFGEMKAEGVWFENFTNTSLQLVKKIINSKSCIIWINDYQNLKPVYINDFGKEYYGFDRNDLSEMGYEFYESFMNPGDFSEVESTIQFFDHNSNRVMGTPYKVKDKNDEWRWTYSLSRAINHDRIGRAIFVLSAIWDIEILLESNIKSDLIGNQEALLDSELVLYNSLTKREREILKLIGRDMTSHEIAEQLYIESSTVDTHRKHIIKKLHAKSSLGLVRYALMYSE